HKHHVPGRPHHRPTGQEQGRRGPCSRRARGSNPRGTLAPATAFEADTLPLGQPSKCTITARAGRAEGVGGSPPPERGALLPAEGEGFEPTSPAKGHGLASRRI